MAIAVKPGNPLKIYSLADFARAKYVALCGITAPCGVYAAQVLAKAKVSINESKITRAVDAKSTLNAVAVGDADAAIVYFTDALAAKKIVTLIKIKFDQNVNTSYAIAAIRLSRNLATAEAFINYVVSDSGQAILKSFGFAKK
jgi:molybdate transport system substrate-binding protein